MKVSANFARDKQGGMSRYFRTKQSPFERKETKNLIYYITTKNQQQWQIWI